MKEYRNIKSEFDKDQRDSSLSLIYLINKLLKFLPEPIDLRTIIHFGKYFVPESQKIIEG